MKCQSAHSKLPELPGLTSWLSSWTSWIGFLNIYLHRILSLDLSYLPHTSITSVPLVLWDTVFCFLTTALRRKSILIVRTIHVEYIPGPRCSKVSVISRVQLRKVSEGREEQLLNAIVTGGG